MAEQHLSPKLLHQMNLKTPHHLTYLYPPVRIPHHGRPHPPPPFPPRLHSPASPGAVSISISIQIVDDSPPANTYLHIRISTSPLLRSAAHYSHCLHPTHTRIPNLHLAHASRPNSPSALLSAQPHNGLAPHPHLHLLRRPLHHQPAQQQPSQRRRPQKTPQQARHRQRLRRLGRRRLRHQALAPQQQGV